MARKTGEIRRTCKQCAHHYDEQEKGASGEFIVARCPFKKWCVLLNYPQDTCDRFTLIK